MLPIQLTDQSIIDSLMADCDAGKNITIDLEHQAVVRDNGEKISFDVDPFRKHCLLNGLDDIGLTMQVRARSFPSLSYYHLSLTTITLLLPSLFSHHHYTLITITLLSLWL